MGFGSIGLHGVPIGSIPLQSGSLIVDWQAEENNAVSHGSDSFVAETPAIQQDFAKLCFQLCKPMGEVTIFFVKPAETNGKVIA